MLKDNVTNLLQIQSIILGKFRIARTFHSNQEEMILKKAVSLG
jgi:hypothetical protein